MCSRYKRTFGQSEASIKCISINVQKWFQKRMLTGVLSFSKPTTTVLWYSYSLPVCSFSEKGSSQSCFPFAFQNNLFITKWEAINTGLILLHYFQEVIAFYDSTGSKRTEKDRVCVLPEFVWENEREGVVRFSVCVERLYIIGLMVVLKGSVTNRICLQSAIAVHS